MSDLRTKADALDYSVQDVTPMVLSKLSRELVEATTYGHFELAFALAVRLHADDWKPFETKKDFMDQIDFGSVSSDHTKKIASTIVLFHFDNGVSLSHLICDDSGNGAIGEWAHCKGLFAKLLTAEKESKGAEFSVNGKLKKAKAVAANILKNGPRSLNNVIGTRSVASVKSRGTNAVQIVGKALSGKQIAPEGSKTDNSTAGLVIPDSLGGKILESEKVTDSDLIALVVALRQDESSFRGLLDQLETKFVDIFGKTLADKRQEDKLSKTKASVEKSEAVTK